MRKGAPGRVGAAQDEHGDADDDEGQQGADVDHLADVVDGGDAAHDPGQQPDQDGIFAGGAESGMDVGEKFAGSRPSLAMA